MMPKDKERIKELEDTLREVRELVQKGMYYKIRYTINKVIKDE